MPSTPTKTVAAAAGGVVAALGSALCCIGPLLAVAVGVSGAGLAAFERWRPAFIALSVIGLGYGHWMLRREDRRACEPGTLCASPSTRRWMRRTLWTGTAVALPLLLFPWWSQFLFS